MAQENPIKCSGGKYRPFVPGDTLTPGIAPVITGPGLIGDGTVADPLELDPDFTTLQVEDTQSVDLTLTGVLLRADVKISNDANNCLELRADGLYMACAGSEEEPATATTIAISAVTASVVEGSNAQYRLTLDIPDLVDIDVNIAYSGTEETSHPADYPDEIVTIPAGNLTHTFTVPTTADAIVEGTLVLTATITGTDHAPALTITTPAANINVTNAAALTGGIDGPNNIEQCFPGDNGPQEYNRCSIATPVGGVAPYTYFWSAIPGDTIVSGQGTNTLCWEQTSPTPMFVTGSLTVQITDATLNMVEITQTYNIQVGGECV